MKKVKQFLSALGVTHQSEQTRDFLFDNIRALLVVFVVWGHLLTSYINDYSSIKVLYNFLFFFHMPALTFISGYFSKDVEKSRANAVEQLLLPYMILNVIQYVFKMVVLQENYFTFRFFRPLWGLWYLFALFIWKFFLKDIVRIRGILPLSFAVGLLSGFAKEFSNYMALGRILGFLPFFLLGYYTSKEHVERIRKIPKWLSVGFLLGVIILVNVLLKAEHFKSEVLYLRKAYPQNSEVISMLYRGLVYLIGIGMIIVSINLMVRTKTILSQIGRRTLTIYILHLFTVPLYEKFELFQNQPFYAFMGATAMTLLITYLYSRSWVDKGYQYFISFVTKLIMKKERI